VRSNTACPKKGSGSGLLLASLLAAFEQTKVMKAVALAILPMLLLLASCSGARNLLVTPDLEEEAIIEAVFRHQLEHCYKSRSPKLFFLSRNGQDLSDSFMEKFKGHPSQVRKRSQIIGDLVQCCEQGLILDVGGIRRVRRTEIEVEGACVAGGLDGYGYLYRVVRESDRWVVKSAQLTWVS
jgi:hypothetical protein